MYIFGKTTNPGVSGTNVDLSNLTGDNQLQGIQNDYRQVFATLLQDWLGANNWVMSETMFEDYAKLALVGSAYLVDPQCYYGGAVTIVDTPPDVQKLMSIFPNPAQHTAEVMIQASETYRGRLTVHSMGGSLMSSNSIQVFAGDNRFYVDVLNMPTGAYVVRLENLLSGRANVAKLSVIH
jgi:hypothetical protein